MKRLYRVRIVFDTVVYAENEAAAKNNFRYGIGQIDDPPSTVAAAPIALKSDLPKGWNVDCIPWGENELQPKTIKDILEL